MCDYQFTAAGRPGLSGASVWVHVEFRVSNGLSEARIIPQNMAMAVSAVEFTARPGGECMHPRKMHPRKK